jgi:hypothetical protein
MPEYDPKPTASLDYPRVGALPEGPHTPWAVQYVVLHPNGRRQWLRGHEDAGGGGTRVQPGRLGSYISDCIRIYAVMKYRNVLSPFVLYQLLLTIGEPEEPIFVDSKDVTSSHPTIVECRRGFLRIVPVASDN